MLDEGLALLVLFGWEMSGPGWGLHCLLAPRARMERARLTVKRVDVDRRPEVAERFKVAEVPTLVLVKEKRVVGRIAGRASAPRIEALLAEHLPEREAEPALA